MAENKRLVAFVLLLLIFVFFLISRLKFKLINTSLEELDNSKLSIHQSIRYEDKTCTLCERLELIEERCKALGLGTKVTLAEVADMIRHKHGFFQSIYVDESHKIIYCPVTKSGSTTFLNLLSQCKMADGQERRRATGFRYKYGLPCLGKDYTKEEIIHRLKHYYKFVVVRHPFDRLVSAHNYVFQSNLKMKDTMKKVNSFGRRYFNETFDQTNNKLKLSQFLVFGCQRNQQLREATLEALHVIL